MGSKGKVARRAQEATLNQRSATYDKGKSNCKRKNLNGESG